MCFDGTSDMEYYASILQNDNINENMAYVYCRIYKYVGSFRRKKWLGNTDYPTVKYIGIYNTHILNISIHSVYFKRGNQERREEEAQLFLLL